MALNRQNAADSVAPELGRAGGACLGRSDVRLAQPARMYAMFSGDEVDELDVDSIDGLIEELETQAALLISVATGGERIDTVKEQHRRRRQRLVPALKRRGLTYPFPWQDLWAWHGYWSSGKLPTYVSRRVQVRELVDPVIEALERQRSGLAVADPGSSAVESWADLNGRITGLTSELSQAVTQDDLQDVGRRAREILIDCAELLADPDLLPPGQTAPKAGDAKAWLDLFLAAHAPGSSREKLRKFVRATWDLAQKVTHADLGPIEAYATAQATVLLARTLERLAIEDEE